MRRAGDCRSVAAAAPARRKMPWTGIQRQGSQRPDCCPMLRIAAMGRQDGPPHDETAGIFMPAVHTPHRFSGAPRDSVRLIGPLQRKASLPRATSPFRCPLWPCTGLAEIAGILRCFSISQLAGPFSRMAHGRKRINGTMLLRELFLTVPPAFPFPAPAHGYMTDAHGSSVTVKSALAQHAARPPDLLITEQTHT